MKKIEHGMVTAVNVGVSWKRSNTEVVSEFGRRMKVYLFGNCIMKQSYNGVRYYSSAGWNTVTTRSRLRALGCNVSRRNGILYRDGREWMEDPILTILFDMDLSKHFEKALQYVRDNHTWSDAEEQVALERIDYMRCGVGFASPDIAQQIRELMDDYGQGEELSENWWEEFGDEDNIFLKL